MPIKTIGFFAVILGFGLACWVAGIVGAVAIALAIFGTSAICIGIAMDDEANANSTRIIGD